jgi:ethanolamine utilization protein EutN
MLICKVKGKLVSTIKDERLNGFSFVVLQVLGADMSEKAANRNLIVAVDGIGCGVGNVVMVTQGSSARYALKKDNVPADAVVVGIVDTYNIENND